MVRQSSISLRTNRVRDFYMNGRLPRMLDLPQPTPLKYLSFLKHLKTLGKETKQPSYTNKQRCILPKPSSRQPCWPSPLPALSPSRKTTPQRSKSAPIPASTSAPTPASTANATRTTAPPAIAVNVSLLLLLTPQDPLETSLLITNHFCMELQ